MISERLECLPQRERKMYVYVTQEQQSRTVGATMGKKQVN